VQYSLWQRVVPFTAIRDIRLEQARAFRTRPIDTIRIIFAHHRSLKLAQIQGGTSALFEVLHRAWENNHAAGVIALPASEGSRRFPGWITWWAIGAALIAALMAPRDIWRQLKWTRTAPDAKSLASFPKIPSGWAGPPVPIYAREAMGHRWAVDYATGSFRHSQTDFYLNDTIPINFTRVFTNRFTNAAFGTGMSASYDITLAGDADRFSWVDLVMPTAEHFRLNRISNGTSWYDAVFRCDPQQFGSTDNPFSLSLLSWDGGGWMLKLVDGTSIRFSAVQGVFKPGRGSPVRIQDPRGNVLTIDRDDAGNILHITSPHGAFIDFRHDINNRIIYAIDSTGKSITYSYDDYGRLTKVNDSSEGVTRYVYDSSSNLTQIIKPSDQPWVTITYDDFGRVIKTVFENGVFINYLYEFKPHGVITAVKVTSSAGSIQRVVIPDSARERSAAFRRN
jgi:YD repeat-containing protein